MSDYIFLYISIYKGDNLIYPILLSLIFNINIIKTHSTETEQIFRKLIMLVIHTLESIAVNVHPV